MRIKLSMCFLLMLLISGISSAKNHIILLNSSQKDHSLLVSPLLNFNTSEQIKEAIDNGTRIQIIAKAQLYEPRNWWFDDAIDNQKIYLEISYFTLSKLYVVKNKETGEQLGFNEYDQLWKEFQQLASFTFDLPVAVNPWVRMRLVLDKGALPTVMQLPVLIDSNWDIDTEWHEKELSLK